MIETILAGILCIVVFIGGVYMGAEGAEAMQPTEQQTEILNKACEYIYENEPLEVYTQYCK